MPPPGPDPKKPLPDETRRLLRQVNEKISTMESMLGKLHANEARTGSKFSQLKLELRARLTACYLARRGLQRGEIAPHLSLDALLLRLRFEVEHRRFAKLGAIRLRDVRRVDLEELSQQLGAVSPH